MALSEMPGVPADMERRTTARLQGPETKTDPRTFDRTQRMMYGKPDVFAAADPTQHFGKLDPASRDYFAKAQASMREPSKQAEAASEDRQLATYVWGRRHVVQRREGRQARGEFFRGIRGREARVHRRDRQGTERRRAQGHHAAADAADAAERLVVRQRGARVPVKFFPAPNRNIARRSGRPRKTKIIDAFQRARSAARRLNWRSRKTCDGLADSDGERIRRPDREPAGRGERVRRSRARHGETAARLSVGAGVGNRAGPASPRRCRWAVPLAFRRSWH